MKDKIKSAWPLAIYMIAFYVLDALRIYIDTSYLYVDRLVLWIVPTFLFIRFYLGQNPFEYMKLSTHIKKGVLWGTLISAVHAAIYGVFWYFRNGTIAIDWNVGFKNFFDVVLTVGIIEEIMFRGFVLEYLRNIYSFSTANIISSFLFILAHIPYWFVLGQFSLPLPQIVYGFIFIFVLGLLYGFFLKKTNSLWACIIHHTVNNFLAFMVR